MGGTRTPPNIGEMGAPQKWGREVRYLEHEGNWGYRGGKNEATQQWGKWGKSPKNGGKPISKGTPKIRNTQMWGDPKNGRHPQKGDTLGMRAPQIWGRPISEKHPQNGHPQTEGHPTNGGDPTNGVTQRVGDPLKSTGDPPKVEGTPKSRVNPLKGVLGLP